MVKIGYSEIIRFFENRSSAEEREAVVRWVNESEEHARLFFSWEEMYLSGKGSRLDEDMLLRKAERRLDNFIAAEKKQRSFVLRVQGMMKYAAAVLMLAMVSGWALYTLGTSSSENWVSVSTQTGEKKEIMLPDGSRVWLNENSQLKYPEKFADEERRLELNGEAYFEVAKNKHKPFTVQNPAMSVQVLGTKFNFKGGAANRMAEASLIEGEIKAVGNNGEGAITLVPGQKVELNTMTRRMKVSEANTALDAIWHDNLIPFKKADIFSIAETLEALYKVEIILSPDIDGAETYSGVLKKKDSIEEVLDVLQNTLHIRYQVRQNTIFLSLNK